MVEPEQVSLRQVGKGAIGRVFKGSIADAFNRISQPSIPTPNDKYLSPKPSVEAFGGCAERFARYDSKSPGPGDYTMTQSESPSMSKKGYGGLVNRTARFKKFQYNTLAPGPGFYSIKNQDTEKSISSIFVTPTNASLITKTESPGVGHYDPVYHDVILKSGFTSVFKSKAKRMEISNSESPPPWKYNTDSFVGQKDQLRNSAAFCQPANAKRYPINLYDPHGRISDSVSPGPGAYEIDKTRPKDKKSFMFIQGGNDRFGKPVQNRKSDIIIPGPGSYEPSESVSKFPASNAVFKDESERKFFDLKKTPGPAFYSPILVPVKKSFHMNFSSTWI